MCLSFCREVNAFAVTVVRHRRGEANNKQLDSEDTDSVLVFVFVVFNAARIGPYCNIKPESLFLERYYSFGVGDPSI